MSAQLRYNPKHTEFEVTVGDEVWGLDMSKDDDFMVLPSDHGDHYCVILEGSELEGVKPNTVYRLVKMDTELLADGEFDEEEN